MAAISVLSGKGPKDNRPKPRPKDTRPPKKPTKPAKYWALVTAMFVIGWIAYAIGLWGWLT